MSQMALLQSPQTRIPFTAVKQGCRGVKRFTRLSCYAVQQENESSSAPKAAPKRRFVPPPDFNPDLKMEKMQDMSDEVWEGSGVVQMEPLSLDEAPTDLKKVGLLLAGDAAMLLLFAAIGRMNHAEGMSVAAVVDTALPFVIGWFATAPFTGAYGKEAQGWSAPKAAGAAAKSWTVALPVGHAIRAAGRGYLPPTPFLIASLGTTLVLLVGYRTAVAAVTPEPPPMTPYQKMLAQNKSGGPLDFLRFLQSMTRRW